MGGGTVRYPSAAGGVRDGTRRPGVTGKRAAPAGPSAATYWRRRFVVLVICLAAIAVTARTMSNAFEVRPRAGAAATTGNQSSAGGGQHRGTTQHAGGSAGRGGAPLPAGASPSGTASITSPASSPSPSPSTSGVANPKICPRQSIVVSLAQVKVAAGRRPTFNVSVVSTQRADCTFNIGPGHLALVIRQGRTRIWSSADCVAGNGGLVIALRRGVPTVVTIGWSEKTSVRRCNGHAHAVSPGAYRAYAVDGSITSAPVAFRLRATAPG
jgi:hypothetical protein